MAKIGILGGTFDPIHIAHLYIAQAAKDKLHLDKVIFMPAANPPHKDVVKVSDFEARYEMVNIAINGNAHFGASKLEKKMGEKKSYTIDTLCCLKEQNPKDELFFIIGLDSLYQLHTWYRIGEIHKCATFVCLARPYLAEQSIEGRITFLQDNYQVKVLFFPTLEMNVSSTAIRSAVKNGDTIDYLVPSDVVAYIRAHNLYR